MTSSKKENPLISVIVPNYNHARYLRKRLDSIIYQSYSNIEIILLDDASTDDSREILAEYAAIDSRIQCYYNEENSGSPFRQWQKGIDLACGEYIWIAESDDFADSTFLETLLQKLEKNATVGLAYCSSWQVDESDRMIRLLEPWASEPDAQRWTEDFINEGKSEIREYPLIGTNIHNTSAVLLRRSLINQVDRQFLNFRYSGDWFFFVSAILQTDIAFCSSALNYYRWHSSSVTTAAEKEGIGVYEGCQIANYLISKVNVDSRKIRHFANYWLEKWAESRTGISFRLNVAIFYEAIQLTLNGRIIPLVKKANTGQILRWVRQMATRFFSASTTKVLKADPIMEHIVKGRVPWSRTYNAYQRDFVIGAIEDECLMRTFKDGLSLPAGYGVGVDERCVEYPWLFSCFPASPGKVLDAGSVLNYDYILDQPAIKEDDLTILTLGPEAGACYYIKGVSYLFADLRDTPIRDNFFDFIVCLSTLEHVGMDNTIFTNNSRYKENRPTDFVMVMNEFRRILKPRGTLLLSVPYGKYQNMGMQQQFDKALLTEAMEAFGPVDRSSMTFYQYQSSGWQVAREDECCEAQYNDWIAQFWTKGVPIPQIVRVEPDLAAAARAVACVQMVKSQ